MKHLCRPLLPSPPMTNPPKLIQLTLNEDETLFVANSIALAAAMLVGERESARAVLHTLRHHQQYFSPLDYNKLTDQLRELAKAAFPHLPVKEEELEEFAGWDEKLYRAEEERHRG